MHLRALAAGLCSFCLLSPLHAEETLPPCGNPVSVPSKPDLEDYPDYTDFLVKIMVYKKAKKSQVIHREACPEDYQPQPVVSKDPTIILEPETLDGALDRAEQIPKLDYASNATWHDRSTSQSFSLAALPGSALASENIRTILANANNDSPLVLPMTIVGMQLDGLNDGANAEHLAQDSAYQTLLYTEGSVIEILFSSANGITAMSNSGNLTFFHNDSNDIVLTNGLIEVESCLSSGCPDL
ncbi:MAG: hypothetical protein ACPH3N_01695 [Alcanivorax sediminis]|uniref:Uncharacterized protein n=1 Tax=Alcanivorax sediminis TaxID=2663008 RepID=A0A6N7LUX9_9GAMM|nr:hypothetical protein [Alcanivorax sediminis]MQX52865.1 hypothetical protein [Alcanivorax sediminis]